jgi:hypothetical protein
MRWRIGALVATMTAASWRADLVAQAGEPVPRRASLSITYATTASPHLTPFHDYFQIGRQLDADLQRVNDTLALPQSIAVVMRECGAENAWYSPPARAIVLCYEMAAAFHRGFPRATAVQRMQYAMDATEFTLYHEIGHAVIDLYQLPIAGREEDAADEFAAYTLLNQGPEAAGRLVTAAIAFRTLPQEFTTAALANEHALVGQRYFNVLCHVAGSNPAFWNTFMVRTGGLTLERLQRCPSEYAQHLRTWNRLLAQHRSHVSQEP